MTTVLKGPRTYVGFGFGAIQAGLFLLEAFRSGHFGRLVVAEVLPEVVAAVRRADGRFSVNVAHAERIERVEVGPVEIENPAEPADRDRLVAAIAAAEEIGTALPDTEHYVSGRRAGVHQLLAEGLLRKAGTDGPRTVVYTAENHNRAAEILEAAVLEVVAQIDRPAVASRVRFLNTVIGKMSGAISDPQEINRQKLSPVTPHSHRAFLVEAFSRIQVSRVRFDPTAGQEPFRRGIDVFEEKANLLPFEEAKLYGHNAVHAMAAGLGAMLGAVRMADLPGFPGVMAFLRDALLRESGQALIGKYRGLDTLFTEDGYRRYADDLLQRMINPLLGDTIERVGRDGRRKLGWDDRLIGAMRLALQQGLEPRRYAFAAAATLVVIDRKILEGSFSPTDILDSIWAASPPDREQRGAVLTLVEDGLCRLRDWRSAGFPPLDEFF
ncbi:MAG: hypothetical protein GWP05_01030 [Anaerolineaceae bacterium]|nr:hypothetical protein [Anaerolineaceae bacterium]